jgi:hypothetical protein
MSSKRYWPLDPDQMVLFPPIHRPFINSQQEFVPQWPVVNNSINHVRRKGQCGTNSYIETAGPWPSSSRARLASQMT